MLRCVVLTIAGVISFQPVPTHAQQRPPKPQLTAQPKPIAYMLPPLNVSKANARKVGAQVWRNETGGSRSGLTAWNEAEDFASMGIGHFIWFPAGLDAPFQESFPTMTKFLRARGAKLPRWLDKKTIPPCPWTNRAQFKKDFNSPRMRELRAFLFETVGLQAQFLILRLKQSMPKILSALKSPSDGAHVRRQYARVVAASPDLYPLIDYINFKGEGIKPTETTHDPKTGKRHGWGLAQVLLHMRGTSTKRNDVLGEFADAAAFVLTRRTRLNPPSKRWLKGWLKRVETYRRPLR